MKPFAFVFPGQGSQSVGMLDGWGGHPAVARDAAGSIRRAGRGRRPADQRRPQGSAGADHQHAAGDAGRRASRPIAPGAPKAAPRRPWWRATRWANTRRWSPPACSRWRDAAPLVRFRAQAMQEAVPVGTGAMAAILGHGRAAGDRRLRRGRAQLRHERGEVVEAVNFNDPAQTVIAGSKAAVEKACEVLKAHGRQARPAAAGVRAVSFQPDEAGRREAARNGWRNCRSQRRRFPSSTISTSQVETDPDRIRAALYEQAFGPVRWVECVQAIKARGVTHDRRMRARARCWPALAKRIDAELHVGVALYDPATLAEAKGAARHERSTLRGTGGAGHRRFARHRRGHRAGTRAARPEGHRHRHHRRRRRRRSPRAGARMPAAGAPRST